MEDETVDGWTLREAVRHLLPQAHQQILASALFAAEIGRDIPGVEHYRPIVWKFLLEQVIRGGVAVTGFPPDTSRRRPIEIDVVQHATVGFDTSELTIGSLVWRGVRFRETLPEQAGGLVEPANAFSLAKKWMSDQVIRPGQWKIDDAVRQCMVATKATFRESRDAWKLLPDDIRGKRGRHK